MKYRAYIVYSGLGSSFRKHAVFPHKDEAEQFMGRSIASHIQYSVHETFFESKEALEDMIEDSLDDDAIKSYEINSVKKI